MCQARYKMLLKAGRGSSSSATADALGIQALREELSSMLRLQTHLTTEVSPLPSPEQDPVFVMRLLRAPCSVNT